ncbi:MAG: sulfatase-like hydrolase/transferase [Phycisphaera sp.]|nr:sulfatase-like hydrolase/transferase [Phycisphaera sp.]
MFARVARAADTPNVVIIFCDDMGWGDVGCFGNPTIRTPNIDRMAAEGQKWTQFYAAAPICTPSRAGLLTGRLPIRNGMTSPKRVVLFPDSGGGLPQEEVTLAELLKQKNYATGMFGKWHLGHLPQYLPIAQGFDEYIGIPYSNDMDRIAAAPNYHKEAWNDARYRALSEHYNVPLMNGEKIIERPADQDHITRRYTTEAVRYIREHKDGPFFLYLAHNMPHIPLFASERFRDKSIRGLFGDVVEELDWSVGQVLDTLRELKIEKKTLVMFCSDNGPWLVFGTHGGSAGPLRAGKGTCWEGGQREPTIFWWPGTIEAGSEVTGMGCTTDMMATIAALTGTQMPNDRKMDSLDLSPTLLGKAPSPRHQMYYWTRGDLHAVRDGAWKLHIKVRDPMNYGRVEVLKKPELYNVEVDISEKFDVADKNPEIVQRLLKMIEDHKADIEPHEDMLAIPLKK